MSDPLNENSYSSGGMSIWTREFPVNSCNRMLLQPGHQERGPAVAVSDDTLFLKLGSTLHGIRSEIPWESTALYSSRMKRRGRWGVLGPGWLLTDIPFLVKNDEIAEQPRIGLVANAPHVIWFIPTQKGTWQSVDQEYALEHDTVSRSFKAKDPQAVTWVFQNFETGIPRHVRGTLKHLFSSGQRLIARHTEYDEVSSVEFLNDSKEKVLVQHEYSWVSDLTQRLVCTITSVDNVVRQRVSYSYNSLDLLANRVVETYNDGIASLQATDEFQYGEQSAYPGSYPLIKQVSSKWSKIDQSACAEHHSGEYYLGYASSGDVIWVHSEGDVLEPQYG